jgi:Protein of unknown function (DUF2971)
MLKSDILTKLEWPGDRNLYHFTNATGLEGIATHRKLHASHHLTVNDADEGNYGFTVFKDFASKSDYVLNTSAERDIHSIFLNPSSGGEELYLTCFSTKRDHHAQWMLYGAEGLGYAIGLGRTNSSDCEPSKPQYLGPFRVVYDRSEQEIMVRDLYLEIMACASPLKDESELNQLKNETWDIVRKLSYCFKDHRFEDESEYRLITLRGYASESIIEFKAGRNGLVPYIPIAIKDANLRILELWAGPKIRKSTAARTLGLLARNRGLLIEVGSSSLAL